MIKKWNEFIKEFVNSSINDLIDSKMNELKDLVSNMTEDTEELMYQWENKDNSELIINIIFNGTAIRYEFNIKNMNLLKIENEYILMNVDVSSVEEGLEIIEKDIQKIVGISENFS